MNETVPKSHFRAGYSTDTVRRQIAGDGNEALEAFSSDMLEASLAIAAARGINPKDVTLDMYHRWIENPSGQ